MRANDKKQWAKKLGSRLRTFPNAMAPLPGIASDAAKDSLVRQLIDSLHRIEFINRLGERQINQARKDPSSPLFDPFKAAHLYKNENDLDEAAWLVFLATHFGKNRTNGWELTRRVYSALGQGPYWTWARTSLRPDDFRSWFLANAHRLVGIPFGNHRKYESIRADKSNNLADVVDSYIAWVGANQGHALLFQTTIDDVNGNPGQAFEALYSSMTVKQFGRTGKFDYLTMIGKLGLAAIEPPIPYLNGATGPMRGARLLFTNDVDGKLNVADAETKVVALGRHLGVGMQVMEDALCNWQKSQFQYVPFRG